MSGKIEVFEKDGDTPILALTVKNQTGGSQASMQARLNDLYEELAEDTLDAIKEHND
jgi:ABC-type phosphonate transport system ATPase subunit